MSGERCDETDEGEVDEDTGDEDRDGVDAFAELDAFTVLVDSRPGANLSSAVLTGGLGVRGVGGERADSGPLATAADAAAEGTSMLAGVLRELRFGRGGAGPNSDKGAVLGERAVGEKLFTQSSVLNDGRVGEAERSCDDPSRGCVPGRRGGGRKERGFSSAELVGYGSSSAVGSEAVRTGLRFVGAFWLRFVVSSRPSSSGDMMRWPMTVECEVGTGGISSPYDDAEDRGDLDFGKKPDEAGSEEIGDDDRVVVLGLGTDGVAGCLPPVEDLEAAVCRDVTFWLDPVLGRAPLPEERLGIGDDFADL